MRRSSLFAGLIALLVAPALHAQGPLSPAVPPTPGAGAIKPAPTIVTPAPTVTTPTVTAPTTATTSSPPPVSAAGTSGLAANKTDTTETKKGVDEKSIYSLSKCLALAEARAPQIKMAADRLAMAHAQLDEVKWIPWSQWSASGGVAMVPEIRGTPVYSPNGDISISSKLGGAWRVGIEGVVPLYTFGKIEHSSAAARAAVEVALQDVQKTKNLIKHDVRRAYFGLQLAHDGRYLLELAKDKLSEAVKKAEANEDTDEADLLRMKTYQMEVLARLGEVEKAEIMTLAGLRFLTGVEKPAVFEIPEEPIAPPKKPLVDVLVYLKSASLHRPELKQVKAGLEARTHLYEYSKSKLYPDIGLGLFAGYANAPIITDQTNAFVVDNANYLRYGFGIVFRWNLDLLPGAARVRYAEAQLDEMRDTEKFALGGVGVEVETAYGVAKDAATREKFYGQAEGLAKKWVATISAAIAVGTREDRDIIDPLRSYLTNRYNHLQAIMDLDVAVSSLSLATGDDSFAEY
jgi:outer membrane protein TolC